MLVAIVEKECTMQNIHELNEQAPVLQLSARRQRKQAKFEQKKAKYLARQRNKKPRNWLFRRFGSVFIIGLLCLSVGMGYVFFSGMLAGDGLGTYVPPADTYISVSFCLGDFGEIDGEKVLSNSAITIPQLEEGQVSRKNYRLIGWSLVEDTAKAKKIYKSGDSLPLGKEDVVLYPIWESTLTIGFDTQTAQSGITASMVANENSEVMLPIFQGTAPNGYDFYGWSTEPHGGGDFYQFYPGSAAMEKPFWKLFPVGEESITLYAVWKAKDINVTIVNSGINANGASLSFSGAYGTRMTIPNVVGFINGNTHFRDTSAIGQQNDATFGALSYLPGNTIVLTHDYAFSARSGVAPARAVENISIEYDGSTPIERKTSEDNYVPYSFANVSSQNNRSFRLPFFENGGWTLTHADMTTTSRVEGRLYNRNEIDTDIFVDSELTHFEINGQICLPGQWINLANFDPSMPLVIKPAFAQDNSRFTISVSNTLVDYTTIKNGQAMPEIIFNSSQASAEINVLVRLDGEEVFFGAPEQLTANMDALRLPGKYFITMTAEANGVVREATAIYEVRISDAFDAFEYAQDYFMSPGVTFQTSVAGFAQPDSSAANRQFIFGRRIRDSKNTFYHTSVNTAVSTTFSGDTRFAGERIGTSDGQGWYREISGGSRINNNGTINPYLTKENVNFSGINWQSQTENWIIEKMGPNGRALTYYDINNRASVRRSDIINTPTLTKEGSQYKATFHFNTATVGFSYAKNVKYMSGMNHSKWDYLRVTIVFDSQFRAVGISNRDRYAVSMMGNQFSTVELEESIRYGHTSILNAPADNGHYIK